MAGPLLHGDAEAAFGDAGCQGVHKRPEASGSTSCVAMRAGLQRQLTSNPFIEPDFVAERVEKMKASVRANVEHPFRVLKRQFGFREGALLRTGQNTAQVRRTVHSWQLVDRETTVDAIAGMSASASRETRLPSEDVKHAAARIDHEDGLF